MSQSPTVFLIVEDEPADAEFIQHAFGATGRADRILLAANGEEAVAHLTGKAEKADRSRFPLPDVIITDLKMPHMNGLELLRWLQTQDAFRNIPRVVLTSSTAPSDIATAYSLGASAFFVKPVDLHELRALAKAMSDFWSRAISPHHSA